MMKQFHWQYRSVQSLSYSISRLRTGLDNLRRLTGLDLAWNISKPPPHLSCEAFPPLVCVCWSPYIHLNRLLTKRAKLFRRWCVCAGVAASSSSARSFSAVDV